MEALNYSIDVKSPFEQSLGGFQAGVALSDLNAKRADAERARQRQIAMQGTLAQLAMKPNAGAKDFSQVIIQYPEIAEHLKKGYDILQPEQQKEDLSHATQVYAAINSQQPEVAVKLLNERAAAQRNSGREDLAKAAETMAKLIDLHPETAKTTAGLFLSSVMGADKFATTFPALGKESRDVSLAPSTLAKTEAEAREAKAKATVQELEAGNTPEAISLKNTQTRANISKLNSDITTAAGRLSLDRDKLESDVRLELHKLAQKAGELPDDARKLVNEAAVGAITAKQHSGQLLDLATRFEKMDPKAGWAAKIAENLKAATGNENEISNLRKEYTRIRSTDVLKLLPPGPASDRDVMLAQKGFPDDTYNPQELASFLRGVAKLSQYDSVLNGAKAEWINETHSLGKAKRDIVIDGVRVPSGTTFQDFSSQFLKRKAEQLGAEQSLGQARTLNRGYLRFADPQQPQAGMSGVP